MFGIIDLPILDEAGNAPPALVCAAFSLAKTATVVGGFHQLAPIAGYARLAEIGIAARAGSVVAMTRLLSRCNDRMDDSVRTRSKSWH
ncbi:hypothetical protein [Massilia sp. S19_KUP03_FR1]|uniref:hypothetical protein n=1 Tax=Massilia sp. S19_KUP03_FR1 TaxID=3025503 RepID=UPI002FCDB139